MKKSLKNFIAGLVIGLTVMSSTVNAEPSSDLRIGRITVQALDIFDLSDPDQNRFIYRAANLLHIQTKEKFIRRELLFKEGAPFDPEMIKETERNLRRFKFLRRVKIDVSEPQGGLVDITVATQDTWTTEPQVDFGRSGNKNTFEVGLVERNLLGKGRNLSATYDQGTLVAQRTLSYRDPQFLGKRLELGAKTIQKSDGDHYNLSLSKPFYSTIAPYSVGTDFISETDERPLFVNGVEAGRFEQHHEEIGVTYGRSLKSTPSFVRQATIGARQEKELHVPVSGVTQDQLSEDRKLLIFEVGGNWQAVDFIKERRIEKFDRDEDFNLGAGISASAGVGKSLIGKKSVEGLPGVHGQIGKSWGPGHFSLFRSDYNTRFTGNSSNNTVWSTNIQHFFRFTERQTLAAHAAWDKGINLDEDDVFVLGEENGLRAYKNKQFSGDQRFLFNLENRAFFVEDVLHLISLGGTAFFDSGYAWPRGQAINFHDLRSAVGVGLRIAFSRSSRNEPIKIDLAYALNDNDQSSRLVLSVSSGVRFGEDDGETRSK